MEQVDQFIFTAPAAKVVEHFVGDGVYNTEAPYGLGVLELQLTGHEDQGPGNLYSIICAARLQGGLYTQVGYIAFKAAEGGQCPAVLYLDDAALQFGHDWFKKFWRSKLEAWAAAAPEAMSITAAQFITNNLNGLKQAYLDFAPAKGREILEALPAAYTRWSGDGAGRWGPGIIGKQVATNATTVGRYLKAFRAVGLSAWAGVPL